MFEILIFTALLHGAISDPKTPRIYNVLISSKKNLAPSQALPVYEPVIRTTSVGLAFPPLYYSSLHPAQDHITHYEQNPLSLSHENGLRETNTVEIQNPQSNPPNTENGYQNHPPNAKGLPNNVIPLQQYLPYYTTNYNYQPFYPRQERPRAEIDTRREDLPGNFEKVYDNNNPKQIVANFKKNPEIPDVPPPPLPVRTNLNS